MSNVIDIRTRQPIAQRGQHALAPAQVVNAAPGDPGWIPANFAAEPPALIPASHVEKWRRATLGEALWMIPVSHHRQEMGLGLLPTFGLLLVAMLLVAVVVSAVWGAGFAPAPAIALAGALSTILVFGGGWPRALNAEYVPRW